MTGPTVAIWHDVECASYAADVELWRELADAAGGPILDIGAGTGRVTLDLARRGHPVTAVDSERELLATLESRSVAAGLDVSAVLADARTLSLPTKHFALAVMPMQVVQLLGGPEGRGAMLEAVRPSLGPGATLAMALANPWEAVPAEEALPPLPDVLEIDGWVYSSLPIGVRVDGDRAAIDRVRQSVSPEGELTDEFDTIVLDTLDADQLEREGLAAGYRVAPSRYVEPTRDYVGSTVVMLEVP